MPSYLAHSFAASMASHQKCTGFGLLQMPLSCGTSNRIVEVGFSWLDKVRVVGSYSSWSKLCSSKSRKLRRSKIWGASLSIRQIKLLLKWSNRELQSAPHSYNMIKRNTQSLMCATIIIQLNKRCNPRTDSSPVKNLAMENIELETWFPLKKGQE